MKKFHSHIWGAEVKVVTDHHALCWLITKKRPSRQPGSMGTLLKGIPAPNYKNGRLHEDADALSRYPVATKGIEDDEDDLLPGFAAT